MQFVIQTGGAGTRLKKITKGQAKSLVKINKKRIIDLQLQNIFKFNSKKIIILNNEKYKSLEFFLKKNYKDKFIFINESKKLGTGGSLYGLKAMKEKDYIMVYGDLVFNFDFKNFFRFHKDKKSDLTLVTHPNSHPFDSDSVVSNKNDRVLKFYNKPHKIKHTGNSCLAGIFAFNKKILGNIKANKFQDFSKIIIPLLLKKKKKVYSYYTREYIKDAGTINRIKEVKKDIKSKKIDKLAIINKIPAIFLDKDGVINQQIDKKNYQDIKKILPNTAKAIKIINNQNHLVILVTNQPAIAKGFVKESKVLKDFRYLESYLGLKGCFIDKIYYCPCHPKKGFNGEVKKYKRICSWRKPNNGMIKYAAKHLNIDLKKSVMIGDRKEDFLAAKKSGIKFFLVGKKFKIENIKRFKDLYSAIKYFFLLKNSF